MIHSSQEQFSSSIAMTQLISKAREVTPLPKEEPLPTVEQKIVRSFIILYLVSF
jgi:hypothetical protein